MNNNKIKILISTDSAALQTGLAETTRNIFLPLQALFPNKYDLHQIGFFHFFPKEKVGWPIYQTKVKQGPNGIELEESDRYGQQTFHEVVQKIKPDIVFGYGDMWHFNHIITSPYRNSYRMLAYYTVDGQPYFGGSLGIDGETEWGSNLAKVDQIVTLSFFGQEVLKASCKELINKDIKVMYHPFNNQIYQYIDPIKKKEIKDKILPKIIDRDKSFITGFVGRNQFRKQNHKLWEVTHYMVYGDYILCKDCDRVTIKEYNHAARRSKDITKVNSDLECLTLYEKGYKYEYCWYCKSNNIQDGVPDPNFYMWFHIPKKDPGYNSELHERMWKVSNNCLYTNNHVDNAVGVTKEEMVTLMASFDCMLYPSGGEGFGNPAFEALGLGVPVVYADYSAHAEYCRFGGLPIKVSTYVPELGIGINRSIIDTGSAVRQLLKLRQDQKLRETLGRAGFDHVSTYDLLSMARNWDSIFTELYNKPLPIKENKLYATTI